MWKVVNELFGPFPLLSPPDFNRAGRRRRPLRIHFRANGKGEKKKETRKRERGRPFFFPSSLFLPIVSPLPPRFSLSLAREARLAEKNLPRSMARVTVNVSSFADSSLPLPLILSLFLSAFAGRGQRSLPLGTHR